MVDIDNGMKMKQSIQTKIRLLLLAILLVGGLVLGLLGWIFFTFQWWTSLFIIIFPVWLILADWVSKHRKGKVMKVISKVIFIPLIVFFIIIEITQPFITIIGTYFFVAMYGFCVPALLLCGLNNFFNIGMLPETIGFITISVGSILFANSYNLNRKIIHWTPLRNYREHRYEEYREQLTSYLIQPSNVVFMLYLIYFVLLVITGFLQIQYGSSLISERYDAAILKAFLVFIAFTNMRTKAQSSDFDSQKLFKHTLGLFVHDDEDWLKKRFSNKDGS
jgi:hypothetical protein